MGAGQKIIDGLKDAVAGNFARVTIDGQTWERKESWQPIKTAPKDSRAVLIWSEMWEDTYGMVIAHWGGDRDGWICPEFITGEWEEDIQPTHWMALPALPTLPT